MSETTTTVPLVLGIGLPHTGTQSLARALERLLDGPCYDRTTAFRRQNHVKVWRQALAGSASARDFQTLLEGFASVVGYPGAALWPQLVAAFPDAKVVLTTRQSRSWFRSHQTGAKNEVGWLWRLLLKSSAIGSSDTFRRDLDHATLGPHLDWSDEAASVECYEQFISKVQRSLPPERLLVLRMGEGWEPLCEFLGVPVPRERPYPHATSDDFFRKEVEREKEKITSIIQKSLLFSAAILATVFVFLRASKAK